MELKQQNFMGKSRRNYNRLVADSLIVFGLILLFALNAYSQTAVRAPASATPGDIAIFGASPNLISDGGAPGSGGTGIATNNGAGNANTFTNATFVVTGNTQAGILITNDNQLNANSVYEEFTGISSTNDGVIEWNGIGGYYGDVGVTATHEGSASPANSELFIISPNEIAIIPNNGNVGSVGHAQLGGGGVPTFWYFNTASNNGVGQVTPSQELQFRSLGNSNNIQTFEWDPQLVATMTSTNNWEGQFHIQHDTGLASQPNFYTPPSKGIDGIYMYIGTNQSTGVFYTGVELFGRKGATVNTLRVDTNGVTVSGIGSYPSNAAPVGVASNLTVTTGSNITNNMQVRAQLVGSARCIAANTLAQPGQATFIFQPSINGTTLFPTTSFGIPAGQFGQSFTNDVTIAVPSLIFGPGDHFIVQTTITGTGSSVTYSDFAFVPL